MTKSFRTVRAATPGAAGFVASFSAISALAALVPSLASFAIAAPVPTFEKNASRFCVSRLSAEEQSRVFSRVMNLGASYSHGCTMCDASPVFRANVIADGEFNFARRNFLARFLARASWKNPAEFKSEYFALTENDPVSNLAVMYPKKELKAQGYNGKWVLDQEADTVVRMTPEWEAMAKASPGFIDESALVGTGFLRRNHKDRDLSRKGHIYQSVPGRYAASGAKQKKIFDLAIDRARSFDMMRYYGDEKMFDRLVKKGWRDEAMRNELVNKTANYLKSFGPSSVFAVDAMFWDAVPRLFHYAKLENPKNLITKILTLPLFSKTIGLDFYDDVQRENMFSDYLRVLALVSAGDATHSPVPVFLGRLIDNPGEWIKGNKLEAEFGALIGTFVEVFSGRNFTEEVTAQLKRLSYGKNTLRALDSNGMEAVAEADGLALSAAELARVNDALARAKAIEDDYFRTLPGRGRETADNGVKPSLPWAVRGAVNAAILSALGDLPLLVKSADRAFTMQNTFARAFTARTDNNVQLVNVDEFYRNFHAIVNKHTMHPTTDGADFMADLVDSALCTSVGPNP